MANLGKQRRVVRSTLADSVYQAILDDILSGVIDAGRELSEVSLAEELGVSRTPVHDALGALPATV